MDIAKMDAGQLWDALYDKMVEEQEKYEAWLTTLPPDRILRQAKEFVIREDILKVLEGLELSQEQMVPLLGSPAPLADVYWKWSKAETHHTEDIRDVIENYTTQLIKGRERPSVLDGLKRPAQPGPDRGTLPKHSELEL